MTKFSNAMHYLRLYEEVHRQNELVAHAQGNKESEAEHQLCQQEIDAAIEVLKGNDAERKPDAGLQTPPTAEKKP